jgi:hypothetical protein
MNFLAIFRGNENLTEDEKDSYDLACVETAKKDIAEHGTIPWESAKEMLESLQGFSGQIMKLFIPNRLKHLRNGKQFELHERKRN